MQNRMVQMKQDQMNLLNCDLHSDPKLDDLEGMEKDVFFLKNQTYEHQRNEKEMKLTLQ